MSALKIYLCDLTHETVILVSDTIPINIGYIASYAKKIHGDNIDISLFKYPQSVIDAILTDPPDIIALSNYSWNSNLSEQVAFIAKSANKDCITVQGGTNFPHVANQQLTFLKGRPYTDFHVELEGEVSFSNIVSRVLSSRDGEIGIFDAPVDGSVFIQPDTFEDLNPILVKGVQPARLKSLDDIPSPYLSGMMDHFFDGRLSPFIETNRGCPFKCSFCHTGNEYFQKINMFSVERINAELEYIASKAQGQKNALLHIADTNFGMFPRDKDICETLLNTQKEYNWPLSITATTGKNNKERVIDITSLLGDAFSVSMSVQSMEPEVLSNINRSNIKLNDYIEINEHLLRVGRKTKGEMILGLPGETKDSFTKGLKKIIDSGVATTTIYSLMMLYGTEFKDPGYRQQYDMEGKYRIVPLNYGEYGGAIVFDYEEICVSTNTMSFEDYLDLRKLALLVETMHNNRPFEEFYRFALNLGLSRADLLIHVFEALDKAPEKIQKNFSDFMDETRNELWNSEAEMINHYNIKSNYEDLMQGKVGGNLIYKYKSLNLATAMSSWIDFLSQLLKELIANTNAASDKPNSYLEILMLAKYCHNKTYLFLSDTDNEAVVHMDSEYDFPAWLNGEEGVSLQEYKFVSPVQFSFKYTKDQIRVRQDQFQRYGSDINALSKIVTRVYLENLFRSVFIGEDNVTDRSKKQDQGTRYALSN